MPQNFSFHTPIRFRQFSRYSYAVFCSLHHVVSIGCIAGYIADLQMNKSCKPSGFSDYERLLHSTNTIEEYADPEEEQEYLFSSFAPIVLPQNDVASAALFSCLSFFEPLVFLRTGGFSFMG